MGDHLQVSRDLVPIHMLRSRHVRRWLRDARTQAHVRTTGVIVERPVVEKTP